jgi:hypothetical protein
MTRLYGSIAAVIVAAGCLSVTSALARPPTVQPSPGYDRRLQESRAAPAVAILPHTKIKHRTVRRRH